MAIQQRHALTRREYSTLTSDKAFSISWSAITWFFISAGIFLRLYQYLDNRSLWIDEVYLATSLIKMNFLQLASPPLEYEQKAPIGFLWMVKLAVLLFGKGEMALRLFPLICGVASLFVFRAATRFFLSPLGVAVAVGILAFAPPLVYHAVEVKQYSTAVLASATALFLYTRYQGKFSISHLLSWGIWGAVLIWFSYAVIFVLAGMAFSVCLSFLLKKRFRSLYLSFIPFSMWLLSFAVNFLLFTYKHADSEWLVYWFRIRESFMPLPPTSLQDFKWFISTTYLVLDYPLGLLWHFLNIKTESKLLEAVLNLHFLPIPYLAAGVFTLNRKNKTTLAVLLFPIFLTLLASGLELYPFYERLLVFLAPLLILVIAFGAEAIFRLFPRRLSWRYVVSFLILLGPVVSSAQQIYNTELFGGRKHWHSREALLYINERAKKGDVVYISWNALPEYRFYNEIYHFQFNVVEGMDVRKDSKDVAEYFNNLQPDLTALSSYDRAWVLFNKKMGANIGEVEKPTDLFAQEIKDGKRFVKRLSAIGEQKNAYKTEDTDVFLFDFSNN